MPIEATIYTRLSGFAGLTAHVGNRIYPNLAPQGVTLPYIVFRRVSSQRYSAMGVDTGDARSRVQVDIFAAMAGGHKTVTDIAAQVRAALQRYNGSDIQDVYLLDEADFFEEDPELHHRALDFDVFYTE